MSINQTAILLLFFLVVTKAQAIDTEDGEDLTMMSTPAPRRLLAKIIA